MAGIQRHSPFVHQADRREHGAAVLIEQHIVPHSFADDFQADSLSFERRGVWAIAIAFDGGLVHKVELNVADRPFTNQGLIRREWAVRYIKLDFMDEAAIEGYRYRPN